MVSLEGQPVGTKPVVINMLQVEFCGFPIVDDHAALFEPLYLLSIVVAGLPKRRFIVRPRHGPASFIVGAQKSNPPV